MSCMPYKYCMHLIPQRNRFFIYKEHVPNGSLDSFPITKENLFSSNIIENIKE